MNSTTHPNSNRIECWIAGSIAALFSCECDDAPRAETPGGAVRPGESLADAAPGATTTSTTPDDPPADTPRSGRYAGLVASSVIAIIWAVLARRSPTTTYHFAPFVVAAAWGVATRLSSGTPGTRGTPKAALGAAVGGAVVAAVTIAELVWLGALSGPTLWHAGSAVTEAIGFACLGAAVSAWAMIPRRLHRLFDA